VLALTASSPSTIPGIMEFMERVVRVFTTFEDAERADEAYYASLTPQQRIEILLELVARHRESLGESPSRFERVHRVTELSKS
jgi:hypothetical protein